MILRKRYRNLLSTPPANLALLSTVVPVQSLFPWVGVQRISTDCDCYQLDHRIVTDNNNNCNNNGNNNCNNMSSLATDHHRAERAFVLVARPSNFQPALDISSLFRLRRRRTASRRETRIRWVLSCDEYS